MAAAPDVEGVRIAELVAALSYAADLGLGQPMAHCMRQTVIAQRLAALVGANEAEREATYYLGLLMNVYCHADASEQAKWFGDDISFKGDGYDMLEMSTAQAIAFIIRRVGSHGSVPARAKRLASFAASGQKEVMAFLTTHSTLGSQFAERLGLSDEACRAIKQGYEHWDGKGVPTGAAGDQISLASRLVHFAGPIEVFDRRRGVEAARTLARRKRGGEYDPTVSDLFFEHAPTVLAGLDEAAEWDAILDAQPVLSRRVKGAELDDVLLAMADLVDMKSPYLAGHSRGVGNLASTAALLYGMSDDDATTLRRAGYLHDLGRLGVSNAIWDKAAPLGESELERIRMHPYLTDRMLARISSLGQCREIASRHHERLDGSGYPRGLTAVSLTPADRILAAADVYHGSTEPRPYRAPLDPDQASSRLRAEVKAGRLDGSAVDAVLTAAGHRAPARRTWPAGLTAREVDVLRLVARGYSNKQIATDLVVSPRTVAHHVEHIYTKLGVSSRALATFFATEHGLMGSYESAFGGTGKMGSMTHAETESQQ